VDISQLGEFGLIERLAQLLGPGPSRLLVGIGDDAAVWEMDGQFLLLTTDTLMEEVHFLPHLHPWPDVGWKALAVNVSDIMAMGGVPEVALVSLALPPHADIAHVEAMYEGLRQCAATYDVAVAGGDVVRGERTSVSVAIVGRALLREGRPSLLRRDGAKPGHVVAVSGPLGDSAGGLRLLMAGIYPDHPLAQAHLRPRPPLSLGQAAAQRGIPCAIDVSDGLLQDLAQICRQSKVSITVWAHHIPISPHLREAFPQDALMLACTGGEDYSLVLIGPEEELAGLKGVASQLTIIGQVAEGEGVRLLDQEGRDITPPILGWDHLRPP